MDSPIFTVFTPTYNRAHTLHRVYECLCLQTFKNFEWLIVDDGSTDNTAELVSGWMQSSRIIIRYIKQNNQGKHVAFNLGVINANGELFVPLDSDDTCIPQALDRFNQRWNSIPKELRQAFSGITCLCKDELGSIVGGQLPADVIDGHFTDTITKLNRQGEMWGFHRTDILRDFPFPVYPGERFVPEGLVWNRIAKKYKTRFINEPLRDYYHSGDGLSRKMNKIRAESPIATLTYYIEIYESQLPIKVRLRAAINAWRFILIAKRPKLGRNLIRKNFLLGLIALPAGMAGAVITILHLR